MKKQNHFKLLPRLVALLLILAWMGMIPSYLSAQTTSTITDDGQIYTYTSNKKYTDITIPASTTSKYLYLEMKAGDGGKSYRHGAGRGATAWAFFEIGTGDHQIKPGSQIRLFPGTRGTSYDEWDGSGSGAGGGGASAAVIDYPADYDRVNPGNQLDDTPWKKSLILMMAGAGGGAGAHGTGKPGNTGTNGTTGRNTAGQNLNNGGTNGGPGGSSGEQFGGASYRRSSAIPKNMQSGFENESSLTRPEPGYHNDLPTGGDGGHYILHGGWGFAGGGNGNDGGGGGGGYSGGGAGGGDNVEEDGKDGKGPGGGGGSFITSEYAVRFKNIYINGLNDTNDPQDGYVRYGLVDLKTINFALAPTNCIDNSGGRTDDGNNIQLWTRQDGNDNQVWLFDNFEIKLAVDANKCLVVKDGDQSNGTNIELSNCYTDKQADRIYVTSQQREIAYSLDHTRDGENKRWIYDGLSKQLRYLTNLDKCVSRNNTNIELADCDDSNNQQWTIENTSTAKLSNFVGKIQPDVHTGKCIDNAGGKIVDHNNIQLWACQSGNGNQEWFFDGTFIRLNDHRDKCLDLNNSSTTNGNNIQLYGCSGWDNQKWIYDGVTKQFRSRVDPNKCIDRLGGSTANSTNIGIWDCIPGNVNQTWIVDGSGIDPNKNVVRIQPTIHPDKCIDNDAGGITNNNNIQLWSCQTGNGNQQWYFDGTTFRWNPHQDKCLDLDGSNTANGRNIQLYDCNRSNAQKWIYDGINKQIRYRANPTKCLDLVNGNSADGTNIQLYDCVYTNFKVNQQWEIALSDAIPIDTKVTERLSGAIHPALAPNKCFSLQNNSAVNNSNIQLEDCGSYNGTYGDRDQIWYFDGMQIKFNRARGKCLDLDGSNTSNGRNIQLFDCNGTDAQKWVYDAATNTFRSKINLNKCLDITNGAAVGFAGGTNVQLYDCVEGHPNQQFTINNI